MCRWAGHACQGVGALIGLLMGICSFVGHALYSVSFFFVRVLRDCAAVLEILWSVLQAAGNIFFDILAITYTLAIPSLA